MSIKITIPNSSSDVLTFGSGNTPTAAQIAGIDSGSSNGQLALYTTASGTSTERVRVDSSGNVGLGVTPSAWGSAYSQKAIQVGTVGSVSSLTASSSNQQVTVGNNCYFDGTNWKYITSDTATRYLQYQATHVWYNSASGTAGNAITFTPAMTLDSSGKLLVGTTSIPFSSANTGVISWSVGTASGGEGGFVFANTSTSTNSDPNPALIISKGSSTYTSSQRFIQFNANGTGQQAMGGIVGNGATNVQFISLSDAREKENIEPITGSLNKITALNPVEFDWKQTGEHIKAGFIAQEVELVFPEYVVDNVANAGEEERKGLTGGMSAGFIAHLVKAIQEQQAIITSLTERLTALENK